ncbi:hypothetical protein NDU88_011870 [Pleurodeles waltl]|uniref:Uncharacterized protein n=1 Tax=Pleurodeles waltl TaxID=8319 RepID=A0AAV7S5I7_PLEWA|nr:hypothetical protein NDU88_011870 [Pleurodeles waltl]
MGAVGKSYREFFIYSFMHNHIALTLPKRRGIFHQRRRVYMAVGRGCVIFAGDEKFREKGARRVICCR